MSRFTESFTASSFVARNRGPLHGMRWLLAPLRFRDAAASFRDKVESIGWPGSSEVALIFAGDEVWLATVPAGRSTWDD
jgi:hypothetical protein